MTRPDDRETYVGNGRAAEILYVSPKTVNRWARAGKIPYTRTLGGHRRFQVSELRALVASLRVEATR
jgi:excisionase family DNA binding protein